MCFSFDGKNNKKKFEVQCILGCPKLTKFLRFSIIIIIFSFTSILHVGMRWVVFGKFTSKLTYIWPGLC